MLTKKEKIKADKIVFSRYQKFIIAMLAFLQFTIVIDFMVLSPLGPFVMEDLSIEPGQFALVVSAYAFSAFVSAIATAGFADRFDRKKLLLFFYCGFVIGTLFCAMAKTYELLLFARIFTGLFGGVIGSITFAIITDLFLVQQRGRVMGFVQMSFAASQILGLPVGLFLAEKINWNFPFYLIVAVSIIAGLGIFVYMKPVTAHLQEQTGNKAFAHLMATLKNKRYIRGFLASVLLATGGYMMMPFGSDFATKNLGVSTDILPFLFLVVGITSIISAPLIGKLSDRYGRFSLFTIGTFITIVIVAIYTRMETIPFVYVITLNVLMFVGIYGRIIPAQALLTMVPAPKDRGAFMSLNSAAQQLSGGISASIAGMIVSHTADGKVHNYPILGYVVIGAMLVALFLMYRLNNMLKSDPIAQEKKKSSALKTVSHNEGEEN